MDDEDSRQAEGDKAVSGAAGEDEEEDPLDAFMSQVEATVKAETKATEKKMSAASTAKAEGKGAVHPVPGDYGSKPVREDWAAEDEEEEQMQSFLAARRTAGLSVTADVMAAGYDSDEAVYATAKAVDAAAAAAAAGGAGNGGGGVTEYDSDDNPILPGDEHAAAAADARSLDSKIAMLPVVDHAAMEYEDFSKDFYVEHADLAAESAESLAGRMAALGVKASGVDISSPIRTFKDASLPAPLSACVSKAGFTSPTPIQCAALPVALSGRDVLGIAQTGSGKTAAYVLPMVVHVSDQRAAAKGEGPVGVVLAPTRELAAQIHSEARRFGRAMGLRCVGVFGGCSKFEQFKGLKAGCELVVATPGRLIDMLRMKALTLSRCTFLVLDEADCMLNMGFEPQV